MNSWNELWDKKALQYLVKTPAIPYEEIHLSINGFNHDVNSNIGYREFHAYLDTLVDELNLTSRDYLYEFGCGSGFFVKSLADISGITRFGGSDLSGNMIRIAKMNLPEKDFSQASAEVFTVKYKSTVIVANGVFQYFRDFSQARDVIVNVISNDPDRFAFLDVPRGTADHMYELRNGNYKSDQLKHLLYTESMFHEIMDDSVYDIVIKEQIIEGYNQSKTRFNVFGRKKSGFRE